MGAQCPTSRFLRRTFSFHCPHLGNQCSTIAFGSSVVLINDDIMGPDILRKQFPALGVKVYGRDLVYFDNAATIQRPLRVLGLWDSLAVNANANIHRAVHRLADEATEAYEAARLAVKDYINASSREEIVFTSGATASINLVAFSFGERFVGEGDEILVSEGEHHSDIVPWQLLCERKKAVLKVIPVDDTGHLDMARLEELCTPRTRIAAVTHISNVLGLVNPVKEIVRICHARGVKVLVDGAQGIVHGKVDVADLGCDFYAFSGHKVYAVPGTGVLYGKKDLLEKMPPFMSGGEMVGTVRFSGTTFAPLPLKFEAGTQNFTGMATLRPALELAGEIAADGELGRYADSVKEYLYDSLSRFAGLSMYGRTEDLKEKISLFSFCIDGVHHEDLALILDKMGIAVRSGQMCAEPLMDRFGVTGMLRVSLAPYNTMEEAEYFMKSLGKAVDMLR